MEWGLRNTQACPCYGCRAWAGPPSGDHSELATRVGRQKAGARQAGPCPFMSMCRVPLSCPDSTADFELPLNHTQPQALSGGQLCLSVLADFPCMTGQVSDQPLLFCPRTIQRTARPHHLDSQEAPPWAPPQLNMTLTLPTAPNTQSPARNRPCCFL